MATYYYHKEGAGFASIFDRDGNDWISYRPGGGSAGEYCGIPNLGKCFHPGNSGSKGARTMLESAGPLRVRFRSETVDGRYAATWDVYSTYARMRLHRAAGPYWFLYEGIPGGKLDVPEDFWVNSAGVRRSVSARRPPAFSVRKTRALSSLTPIRTRVRRQPRESAPQQAKLWRFHAS